MRWTKEALARTPFFVRKRVEEEAANRKAGEVTLEHVCTCQKMFLNRMEDEVKGFQVETCFGSTGCTSRGVNSDGLPGIHGLEEVPSIVEQFLNHYKNHCKKGERFGIILERTGIKDFI